MAFLDELVKVAGPYLENLAEKFMDQIESSLNDAGYVIVEQNALQLTVDFAESVIRDAYHTDPYIVTAVRKIQTDLKIVNEQQREKERHEADQG